MPLATRSARLLDVSSAGDEGAAIRWVIVGAGAVGGVIGGRLLERTGDEVVLVARGAHAEALAAGGLRLLGPASDITVRPTAVWQPEAIGSLEGVVIVLAVKSHQTAAALAQLGPALDEAAAVVCAQNGVTNEDEVAAVFAGPVLGAMVWMPAVHLEPGVVESHGVPDGFFLIGDWRAGGASAPVAGQRQTGVAATVCARLREAGFVAEAVADVARWKRAKLLTNLGNALDAFCVEGGPGELQQRVTDEGRAVLDAAGLAYADPHELVRRAGEAMDHRAGTRVREGGSTWQSLARGRDTEVGHLNGYIARLGREIGVDAPLNRALVELAPAFERGQRAPRSLTIDELRCLAGASG